MKISLFGLGYVGAVTAACLSRDGHYVVGVDNQQIKVDIINGGKSPVVEEGVAELIKCSIESGRLRATTSVQDAIEATDISFVCVGTPSRKNGSLDTDILERVCQEIGAAVAEKKSPHTVVIRSTILPGTMRSLVIPTLRKAAGEHAEIHVANNPEFLREASAVYDYDNPPKIVVGAESKNVARQIASIYGGIDAPCFLTSVEVAELVKYADNAWHAVKVAFGNEIGNIGKAVGIDSHEVMSIFCKDEKLNISSRYLMPGFAFGGSCLPKDVRALSYKARELDLALPLLNSVLRSNEEQISRAFDDIMAYGKRKIAFFGISFKSGTDDLRESPQVTLVERLLGKGMDILIYDRFVNFARLHGANREHILNVIPHISSILVDDFDRVSAHGDILVVGNSDPQFHTLPATLRDDQQLYDLVRLNNVEELGGRYAGVNW
ncbi:nucleotide sugar dehydrogenase (plasmid) [Aliirhizobium terrae]|uniref:nucleotide sugar dehydrogenase n=1 Tax=Terrirhizobium terrae TaxID=2926709 RepID=UPI0025772DF2|nr:nucleotide sugar dehydrogenase [Rhizobium sp. CC-CFT758]WJH37649.1 nucleotide sugar dehydrogenase [Rhizobium sp. CC-CFT758]